MNVIIKSTIETLRKSNTLLAYLKDDQLSDATIGPYYSSIGRHLRHILDFYHCIFNSYKHSEIDLTARPRNINVESNCENAKNYLNEIICQLEKMPYTMDQQVIVIDDLGLGKTRIPYTFGALLTQANSHTIHHYAIINYILEGLNISIQDSDFGYNPTTPKQVSSN